MSKTEQTFVFDKKEYKFKEKYGLKDWNKVVSLIQKLDNDLSVANILNVDFIPELLTAILDTPTPFVDVYEEDFEEIGKVLESFFSRKTSLKMTT